jgi:two-component system, OmpR family, sensor histidine kinase MprB
LSFRLRLTLLVAAAVAASAIAAAAVMYVMVQGRLLTEFDGTLQDTANSARVLGPRPDDRFGGRPGGGGTLLLSGRPDIFAQIVDSSGNVTSADGQPAPGLVTSEIKAVASGQRSESYADITIDNKHWRAYAIPLGPGRALELARPLTEIDAALASTRLALVGLALAAAILGAALAAIIARTALRPVAKLTATVEEVTRTRDLSRRVAAEGRDELSRLGTSFDAMLGQLETSLRSQRQLVADASHELRTPLTSLRTNLELLERGQPTDPVERQQLLGDLVIQMERMTTLVGDLIEVAREEESPMPFEKLQLEEIVQEVVDDMSFRYPKVHFNVTSSPSTINGVKVRVARAITNLLDNAAKYSPPGATVDVAVANGEISVRDHGPGVTAEDATRVFDRFWRSNDARHLPGSGLGLAIVKDVAESHGGSVTLERPIDGGGGARFRLRLKGA